VGYYTHVRGEIEIDPPLTWAEVREADGDGFWPPQDERSVELRIVETSVETNVGTLRRREGVSVIPATEDGFKAYHLLEHVQAVLDRWDGPHAFAGRFDCSGEENGDLWRLEIQRDSAGKPKAVKIQARIVWPNGEAQEGRR